MEINLQRAADQIDTLISRRIAEREQSDWEANLWEKSVQAHAEKARAEHRNAWREYHLAQARRIRTTAEALVAYHEGRAAALEGAIADAP